METLFLWIQRFVVLCLLFSAVSYLIPEESYKKYLRFFMELLLVLFLLKPFASMAGGDWERRFQSYYEQFCGEMEMRQREGENFAFLDENYIAYLMTAGQGEAEREGEVDDEAR